MAPAINMLSNWVFSPQPEEWPCKCCDAPRAMDHEDGYWVCSVQEYTWRVLDGPFNPHKPHALEQCCGGCAQHPLINDEMIQLLHSEVTGLLWGDLLLAEEDEALKAETPEQRAKRLLAEEAQEAHRYLAIRAADMERYARLKAQVNTIMVKDDRGKKTATIRKVAEPCKWLYLDESAPKSEWRRTKAGKQEPPYRPYLTGAICWAWEYKDPKTKQLIVKHTCDHLHPGEEGWCKEWDTDGRWRPAAAATRDFSGLRDFSSSRPVPSTPSHPTDRTTPSAPVRPPPPKGRKNCRGTFLDFDDFEC